jgi:hypothetical protein
MADCSLTAAERSDPLALEQAVLRRRTSFSQRSLGKGVCCSLANRSIPRGSFVLEWKRWSGSRRLHVGLVGIVTGSVPGATPHQTFEHKDEHEHDLVAALPRCALLRLLWFQLRLRPPGAARPP